PGAMSEASVFSGVSSTATFSLLMVGSAFLASSVLVAAFCGFPFTSKEMSIYSGGKHIDSLQTINISSPFMVKSFSERILIGWVKVTLFLCHFRVSSKLGSYSSTGVGSFKGPLRAKDEDS